ncbi:MAG TPA: amino acid permease [Candidatus Acidoferrales bacterium]|nr:amino acid permease [Candidatus Acidoferrales bacterium]
MPPAANSRDSIPGPSGAAASPSGRRLAARLGLFDATMAVMGGIIGSGIFINPYVVAEFVHTPGLILGVWVAGGAIALAGAFVYAELAARMPQVGGQYAYLREAYHPVIGFLYGWVELLVIGAGGTAATAVTFARYFHELAPAASREALVAVIVVALLTLINCAGVRAGSGVQSLLMVLRILAVGLVVACGAWLILHPAAEARFSWSPALDRPVSFGLLTAIGATMVPVLFAYGGWQTTNYIASEIRDSRRTLPRALLLGVVGVVALYVAINFVYVRVLAPAGLAGTTTPASAVMRRALGGPGAALIAVAIAISTLGFLSQAMLTYPRVYFAMAEDGVLPGRLARLSARSQAPVMAIALQGAMTIIVVLLGTFEQILSYVVVMDWLFFGLSASCLFVFRARERRAAAQGADPQPARGYRAPGHPWTTALFTAVAWLVVLNTIYKYPRNSAVAVCILLSGIPVYFWFRGRASKGAGCVSRP